MADGTGYKELKEQYGGFMVPAMEVSIGGETLTGDLGFIVDGVKVSLSLEDPSTASFQINNCYDVKGHAIKDGIRSKLKLGAKVGVKLGYGSSIQTMFAGYIDSVSMQYSEEGGYSFGVSAADVIKLMKENGSRQRTFQAETYSQVFQELMADYSSLCEAEAEDTGGELKVALLQESSDYDFIMKDLIEDGRPDYEFLVSMGKAYYRKHQDEAEVVAEFSPGAGLQSCNWTFSYVDRSIQVLGYHLTQDVFVGEALAASEQLADTAVQGTEVLKIRADSQDKVDGKAADYASQLVKRASTGSLTVTGLPELIPGKSIRISQVDESVDGVYFINGVEHDLGENGFTSQLRIGR